MSDYEEMYITLFSAMTKAISILQQAQQVTEEMYLSPDLPDSECFDKNTHETNNRSLNKD